MINALLWQLPRWAHTLILCVTGWRLIRITNYFEITPDGTETAHAYSYKWSRVYPLEAK